MYPWYGGRTTYDPRNIEIDLWNHYYIYLHIKARPENQLLKSSIYTALLDILLGFLSNKITTNDQLVINFLF